LRDLFDLGIGRCGLELGTQGLDFAVDINGAQQLADGFRTHQGVEVVTVFFRLGHEVVVRHDLAALDRRHASLDHAPCFEVQHAYDIELRNVQKYYRSRWQVLGEPDVRDRAGQLNVAHALASHLGHSHFETALYADHSAMLEALVLTAKTLVVLVGTKDLGAEQTVTLRLKGAVVNRLGLAHFAERPRADLFRRSNTDANRIELFVLRDLLEEVE